MRSARKIPASGNQALSQLQVVYSGVSIKHKVLCISTRISSTRNFSQGGHLSFSIQALYQKYCKFEEKKSALQGQFRLVKMRLYIRSGSNHCRVVYDCHFGLCSRAKQRVNISY